MKRILILITIALSLFATYLITQDYISKKNVKQPEAQQNSDPIVYNNNSTKTEPKAVNFTHCVKMGGRVEESVFPRTCTTETGDKLNEYVPCLHVSNPGEPSGVVLLPRQEICPRYEKLLAEAETGAINVNVTLALEIIPETYLSPNEIALQREQINNIQKEVIKSLYPYEFRVYKQDRATPKLSIRTGYDGLEQIVNSRLVIDIVEDARVGS